MGVNEMQVSKWERGVNRPGADSLAKLARAYRVEVGDLLIEPGDEVTAPRVDSDGATVTIPRDLAMYWRGQLDNEIRHLAGMARTLDSLREMLAEATGTFAGMARANVLPPAPTPGDGLTPAERAVAAEVAEFRRQRLAKLADDETTLPREAGGS